MSDTTTKITREVSSHSRVDEFLEATIFLIVSTIVIRDVWNYAVMSLTDSALHPMNARSALLFAALLSMFRWALVQAAKRGTIVFNLAMNVPPENAAIKND